MGATKFKFQTSHSRKHVSMKLLEQFKDTLPYMPSEYCGKQQSGFCIWPLGQLSTTETSFVAKITTVG